MTRKWEFGVYDRNSDTFPDGGEEELRLKQDHLIKALYSASRGSIPSSFSAVLTEELRSPEKLKFLWTIEIPDGVQA